jgi:hypothetical protein
VGSDTGDPIQVYELVGTFVVENGWLGVFVHNLK